MRTNLRFWMQRGLVTLLLGYVSCHELVAQESTRGWAEASTVFGVPLISYPVEWPAHKERDAMQQSWFRQVRRNAIEDDCSKFLAECRANGWDSARRMFPACLQLAEEVHDLHHPTQPLWSRTDSDTANIERFELLVANELESLRKESNSLPAGWVVVQIANLGSVSPDGQRVALHPLAGENFLPSKISTQDKKQAVLLNYEWVSAVEGVPTILPLNDDIKSRIRSESPNRRLLLVMAMVMNDWEAVGEDVVLSVSPVQWQAFTELSVSKPLHTFYNSQATSNPSSEDTASEAIDPAEDAKTPSEPPVDSGGAAPEPPAPKVDATNPPETAPVGEVVQEPNSLKPESLVLPSDTDSTTMESATSGAGSSWFFKLALLVGAGIVLAVAYMMLLR